MKDDAHMHVVNHDKYLVEQIKKWEADLSPADKIKRQEHKQAIQNKQQMLEDIQRKMESGGHRRDKYELQKQYMELERKEIKEDKIDQMADDDLEKAKRAKWATVDALLDCTAAVNRNHDLGYYPSGSDELSNIFG